MFGVSFPELVVIFLVALLVYGPERLPEIAGKIGRLAAEFRRVSDSVRREFYNSMYKPAEDELRRVDRGLRAAKNELAREPDPDSPRKPQEPQPPHE